jgi:hypothetical protein
MRIRQAFGNDRHPRCVDFNEANAGDISVKSVRRNEVPRRPIGFPICCAQPRTKHR